LQQRPSSNPRQNPPPEQQILPTPPPPPPDLLFSPWSSPAIRNDSSVGYACEDFMVVVGMVVIQKGTGKVVIVSERKVKRVKLPKENPSRSSNDTNVRSDLKEREDKKQKDHRNDKDKTKDHEYVIQESVFLPKGRKDLGETLQDAALREAYEESGYKVSFLPIYKYSQQPPPPSDELAVMRPDTEPFYMTVTTWRRGEYFVLWFLGEIEEDAIHTPHTGMPDEQNYVSHLVTFDEALKYLSSRMEKNVVRYAKRVWDKHVSTLHMLEQEGKKQETEEWLETVGID